MEKSKLAIVIPFYKKKFFKDTLSSLTLQTDSRFHVYIGNDGSLDDPRDLLESLDGKINYTFKSFPENVGSKSLVGHWNRCLQMVKNESWVLFLGDDDVLGENVVAHFYKNYTEISIYKCCRFSTIKINEIGKAISKKIESPKLYNSKNILFDNIRCSLSEHVFHLKTLRKIGFKNYPLAWFSDVMMILRISNFGYIHSVNSAVVKIRVSKHSISGTKDKSISKIKNLAQFKFYRDLIFNNFNEFSKKEQLQLVSTLSKTYLRNKKSLFRFFVVSYVYILNMKFMEYLRFLKEMYYKQSSNK
jgi:hypothetical protein